ncbi:CoA-binding protein [Bacteroidetes/Chlorobi group bacterium ChocPot_Mid]|jgi:predicted CoA-binding protein|nr:MAG: CoA-binding protein [Bacteroidetes/Chlorobi group bacterium ChocPot_Mid]
MTIREIFEKYKTVAVYGMSTNEAKPSHYVPVHLINNGYNVIPINPVATEIAGRKAYKNIMDIQEDIEILNVFRPSEQVLEVVKEAIERKKQRGDIDLIWLQEGIVNDEAKKLAEDFGIEFIQDKCMLREHKNLW